MVTAHITANKASQRPRQLTASSPSCALPTADNSLLAGEVCSVVRRCENFHSFCQSSAYTAGACQADPAVCQGLLHSFGHCLLRFSVERGLRRKSVFPSFSRAAHCPASLFAQLHPCSITALFAPTRSLLPLCSWRVAWDEV